MVKKTLLIRKKLPIMVKDLKSTLLKILGKRQRMRMTRKMNKMTDKKTTTTMMMVTIIELTTNKRTRKIQMK